MKPRKLLMILGVSILIYYVARQVQIRNKYVENLTEDRILSNAEVDEIVNYYRSTFEDKPDDPSKLSNKAKVFVNTATAHPFTVLTDSTIDLVSKGIRQPLSRQGITVSLILITLHEIFSYQHKHAKSDRHRTRSEFVREIEDSLKADKFTMRGIEETQKIMSGDYSPPGTPASAQEVMRNMLAPMRDMHIALWGNPLLIKNLDGTQSINMSGPLQTNMIDLAYAYLYPNQDIFSWILSLFSGKN